MDRLSLIHLYRSLLKHAIHYPSINRQSIIDEIRIQWRLNQSLIDTTAIDKATTQAKQTLIALQKFTNLNDK